MGIDAAKIAIETETGRLLMAHSTLVALSREFGHDPVALDRIMEVARFVRSSAEKHAVIRKNISRPAFLEVASEIYEVTDG